MNDDKNIARIENLRIALEEVIAYCSSEKYSVLYEEFLQVAKIAEFALINDDEAACNSCNCKEKVLKFHKTERNL